MSHLYTVHVSLSWKLGVFIHHSLVDSAEESGLVTRCLFTWKFHKGTCVPCTSIPEHPHLPHAAHTFTPSHTFGPLKSLKNQHSHFFHLESDGRPDLVDFLLEIVIVSDHGGEFSSLAQPGTQEARDLLDQAV